MVLIGIRPKIVWIWSGSGKRITFLFNKLIGYAIAALLFYLMFQLAIEAVGALIAEIFIFAFVEYRWITFGLVLLFIVVRFGRGEQKKAQRQRVMEKRRDEESYLANIRDCDTQEESYLYDVSHHANCTLAIR